ncbi:DUF2510 domain-containing protein [Microbacterium aerolatum]|uniref:DUF2510 domain-containing protein n=1 Tax=Microbacterium aerolatum TaxID=153731 RepID=UPI00384D7C83
MSEATTPHPAAWHPDPTGRHQYRYWDGAIWTEHVADNSARSVDPLDAAPPTRREVRQQLVSQRDSSVGSPRPTFAQRRAAARAERKRGREAAQEVLRQRELVREQERLEEAARKRAAREAAEGRARAEAEAREQARLAQLAREQVAREAAAREIREAEERAARILTYPPFYLPEYNGYPSTEVAGEFARIDAIHAVLGRRPKLNEELINEDLLAALVPEPSNPYDRSAVKVIISGQHVGYLEKEVAAALQPTVISIVEAGYLPTVGARVWAIARQGYESGKKPRHFANVRLALPYASRMLPLNDPPFEAYSILPWAASLQVTGEEQHQEVLAEHITPDDESLIIGTLHPLEANRKNGKDLVEIRIDGERVGQLTPASSQHFLPTIWHLHAQGMTTAAWLLIKGSAIAAQVTIHATRAHQLPSVWFETAHTAPRLHGSMSHVSNDGAVDDAEIRAQMREPMWDD